jgi:hypothetical protein
MCSRSRFLVGKGRVYGRVVFPVEMDLPNCQTGRNDLSQSGTALT